MLEAEMADSSLDRVNEASVESFPARDAPAWTTGVEPTRGGVPAMAESGGWQRVARDGLIAGVIGYATVALFFIVASLLQGESPFFIAALLGSTLFPDLRTTAELSIEPGLVFAYNGVHLVVFLAAGLFMGWLASLSEKAPQAWYAMLVILVFVVGHVIALPVWFDAQVSAALSLWLVVVATLLGTALMAAYLWRSRPGIRAAAHEPED
jgi:hypothetical protein